MTVAEGGGRRAVQNKLRDMYVPTLKANFMVWPAVQMINFRLMPMQFQLVCLPRLGGIVLLHALTAFCAALRLHGRYRLDSVSLPDQRGRGCRTE
jgi:Mpv17/PMP22 family protein